MCTHTHIYVYILVSKHKNKDKYQMKSKFIREERLSNDRKTSVQQKLLYKQRVITTLEHMYKKASRQCSATLISK